MTQKLDLILTQESITNKIAEMGKTISADFAGKKPIFVCVLRGSVYFAVDLTRQLSIPFVLDFISISKYNQEAGQLGVVRITKDLDTAIQGREVIIIEDIVDTGLSLNYLIRNLKTRDPADLRVCTLLNVPSRRIADVQVDYHGFEIPNVFAVGYGLDYHEEYRNLMDIFSFKKN